MHGRTLQHQQRSHVLLSHHLYISSHPHMHPLNCPDQAPLACLVLIVVVGCTRWLMPLEDAMQAALQCGITGPEIKRMVDELASDTSKWATAWSRLPDLSSKAWKQSGLPVGPDK